MEDTDCQESRKVFLAVGNAELIRELRGRLGAHVSSTPHGIKMPFHLNDGG